MPLLTLKLFLAWLWFFILLLSYYILKPIRDGIGSILSEELSFWYLATFIFTLLVMSAYARLVQFCSTKWLIFNVHQGFAVSLLFFAISIGAWQSFPKWYAGIFFVWVSVFNLCSVALFWSVMADVYSKDEGQKWFGIIAGAGSVGALIGSEITLHSTQFIGHRGLLTASLIGLELSFVLAWWIVSVDRKSKMLSETTGLASVDSTTFHLPIPDSHSDSLKEQPITDDEHSPSLWHGFSRILKSPYLFAICLYILFGKFSATFIYNNLQSAMSAGIESAEKRTELFAQMNVVVQFGSMVLQYLIVSWLFRVVGVKSVLAIPCIAMIALFSTLYFDSSLTILIGAQVIQQIIGYGLMTPSQNLLFTVVSRHDKYVSKGFVDTVVFRFSDVLASKLCAILKSTHLTLGNLSIGLIPILLVWFVISQRLGRQFRES